MKLTPFPTVMALSRGAAPANADPVQLRVVAAGDDCTELLIYGAIGASYFEDSVEARAVVEALQGIDTPKILARINSFGGSVTDGLAIANALRLHPADVTTRIEGAAYSAASLIAMAGDVVEQAENSLLMIHAPWTYCAGNAAELRDQADTLDTYANAMVSAYSTRTGDESQARAWLTDGVDHYFTAEQAEAAGLVDSVVATTEALGSADTAAALFQAANFADMPDPAAVLRMRNASDAAAVLAAVKPRARAPSAATLHGYTPAPAAPVSNHPAPAGHDPAAPSVNSRGNPMNYRKLAKRLGLTLAADVSDADVVAAVLAHLSLPAGADDVDVMSAATDALAAAAESARAEAVAAERQRVADIRAICEPHADRPGVVALRDAMAADANVTIDGARTRLLDHLGQGSNPVAGAAVTAGEDSREKFRAGAMAAMLHRVGMGGDDRAAIEGNELRGLSLVEMARRSLELSGTRASGSRMQVVGMAFTHSSDDFKNLLANLAEKALLRGFNEIEEAFPRYTVPGELSDFKTASRTDLDTFPNLLEVPENGEYKYGTIGDRGELIKLRTFGRLFGISRQAVINDDLRAMVRIPQKVGQAARRTIGSEVVTHLHSNPTMGDGTALFHKAKHKNLQTGAAITTQSVEKMRAAMRTQKMGDATLAIPLAMLVVPSALSGVARQVANGEYEVTAAGVDSTRVNHVRGSFEVVEESRLDALSAAAWYGFANPAQYDTIEVAYLDGNDQPRVEMHEGWTVDGVEFKGAIDFAVKALEYHNMQKNPGA